MYAIQSPYEVCPVLTGESLELRLVRLEDANDLLRCYSDPKAQQLFNSDNCTNKFEYATVDEMKNAISFWIDEYHKQYYVRFSIVSRQSGHAIGTIEFFPKFANDGVSSIGVLRIDLRSDFEAEDTLQALLQMIEAHFPRYFMYVAIVTKVVESAERRRIALQNYGFVALTDKSIMNFDGYYIKFY